MSSTSYRLAHVTDPHFRSFAGAHVTDFMGKRAIGALNLVVNRRRFHKMELLALLGVDLAREQPEHVALTGDISNVSLESEWQEGLRWLEALGRDPDEITVVPGNHDTYVPAVERTGAFERCFGAYQRVRPETGETAGKHRRGYPFVRLRGPLALVAVNSCVATGDLGAWGSIGTEQLAALAETLASPAVRARVRVVVMHHPPVMFKGGEERNLRDRTELAAVLREVGAELVIHGHDHRDEAAVLLGPHAAKIPVVGAGSASYAGGPERRARYNIYEFRDRRIFLVTRAHDATSGAFREVFRQTL